MNVKEKIINHFFNNIHLNKSSVKILQNRKKNLNKNILFQNYKNVNYYLIKFIINISYSKSNTFLHIMNCFGQQNNFFSISILKTNNNKKFITNNQIFEKFYKILIAKFTFLQNVPIALHFNGTELNNQWFIEKIFNKFFIVITKLYNKYSYNGCRKKKLKKIKF